VVLYEYGSLQGWVPYIFLFLLAFASCRSSATKAVDEKASRTSLAALFIGSVAY